MRKITSFSRFALASMAFAALGVSAHNVADFPTLSLDGKKKAVGNSAMRKAPLNQNKGNGPYVFGGMIDDFMIYRNFASFYAGRPSIVTKLKPLYDEGDEIYQSLFGLLCGCYGPDGNYYGFRYKFYTFVQEKNSFIKANPFTGEYSNIRVWESYKDQLGEDQPYEMAYNPANGLVYALAHDTSNPDEAFSKIGTIDLKTGEFKDVCSLNRYYFGIAFDYDGNLYGITWTYQAQSDGTMKPTGSRLDRFDDKFEVASSSRLLVNDKPFVPNYMHSLEFDYTTGDLYWAATDADANQYLVKIDPANGKTENKGYIGYQESVLGLHIPFQTADARTAPARVEGLGYESDPEGADKVKLTWTNPKTQWNREELQDLLEVNIYRDEFKGEPAARVDAKGMVGEPLSWTDDAAARGLHKYYVVATSVRDQKGIMDSISCFVGKDLPGAPANVNASTPDGKSVNLSWSIPDRGDSDGWFDKESVKYTVTRMPDGKLLAENIVETSLEDKDIPEATTYFYHVVATNNEGSGEAAVSNGVLAGKSITVPFSTNFPNQVEAGRFSYIDNNADGKHFGYDYNTNLAGEYSYLLEQHEEGNDDYLVSPPLNVKEGRTYRVYYTVSVGHYSDHNQSWTQSMNIIGGQAATMTGLSDNLAKFPLLKFDSAYGRRTISADFTAEADGDYYVALHCDNVPGELAWLYVENFAIQEVGEKDLEAIDIDSFGILGSDKEGGDNAFKVTISNNGSKEQSEYKVQVCVKALSGTLVPIAETTEVPSIKPNEKAVVELGNTLDVEDGVYDIVGYVEIEGDSHKDNDVTDSKKVIVNGGNRLNVMVNGDEGDLSSNLPMQFYNPYSAAQTIYTPEMLGVKAGEDGVLSVRRLAWTYTSKKNILDSDVEIYLSQTSKPCYSEDFDQWVDANQECVFNGKVNISEGRGALIIDLDNDFEFDPEMPLVVTVVKGNMNEMDDFPVLFDIFDNKSGSTVSHSYRYNGAVPFRLDDSSVFLSKSYKDAAAPVLYMSAPGAIRIDNSGVCPVQLLDSVSFGYADGRILFNGISAVRLSVWSADGKLVRNMAVNAGSDSEALGVAPGIYMVNVIDINGNSYNAKINVK